jgi:hypothetical protein
MVHTRIVKAVKVVGVASFLFVLSFQLCITGINSISKYLDIQAVKKYTRQRGYDSFIVDESIQTRTKECYMGTTANCTVVTYSVPTAMCSVVKQKVHSDPHQLDDERNDTRAEVYQRRGVSVDFAPYVSDHFDSGCSVEFHVYFVKELYPD